MLCSGLVDRDAEITLGSMSSLDAISRIKSYFEVGISHPKFIIPLKSISIKNCKTSIKNPIDTGLKNTSLNPVMSLLLSKELTIQSKKLFLATGEDPKKFDRMTIELSLLWMMKLSACNLLHPYWFIPK